MKKTSFIYIIICLALVGCSDEFEGSMLGLTPTLSPTYLNVNPTSLSFGTPYQETKQIAVTSINTPWTVNNEINWVTASPSSGSSSGTVNVGVSENTSGDDIRTGIFYLKADTASLDYEFPISVSQVGARAMISLSQSEIEFNGAANNGSITVTANCSWSATSSQNWLKVEKNDNKVLLSVTENTTSTYRNATVTVDHVGNNPVSQTLTVRQAPASINASTETLVFSNAAGSVNITVNSEASWAATTSSSWIEVDPTSSNAGTSTLKISVAPNTAVGERTGHVILSIGNSERIQIPIRQRGIYIETEQSNLSFAAAGGSQNLSVQSNTSWTVSTSYSWITVSPSSGDGDKQIKVTVQDNPNTSSRSGSIHIKQEGLNIDVRVTVSQEGKTFDVGTTLLNFTDKESTQTVNIETDGTWTASANHSWITVSPTSATGNSVLSVTCAENTGDNERSGQVTVKMGDKSAVIEIRQSGKYFTVSDELLTFNSKGGSLNVSITTNDSWTAKVESGSSWLSLSKTSGTGNLEVKVTASDNASVNSRTGTILFETTHNKKVRVTVTQKARYLTVDTQEILFYYKGGTSEAVTISTDGTYKITCSDSWFSVKQSGNTFTVTATENTTSSPRIGTITIALTGLTEGSYSLTLTVTQLNEGGSFLRNEYGNDQNYDNTGTSSGNLTITGYGSDQNYDSYNTSGTTLSISSFQSDSNWDPSLNTGITVTITGFNSDQNHDPSTSSSATLTRSEYGSDNNWQ